MDKILNWISKNKKKMVFVIGIIIVSPMLVVHILYQFDLGICWISSKWEPGDMLGYFGDVLSFLGATVLGYVAICQTEKANALSEKILEFDLIKSKPCLDFVNAQKYNIGFICDGFAIEEKYKQDEVMVLRLLYTTNPRTGMTKNIGVLECEVTNSGHSDIRFIYIEKVIFYFSTRDKRSRNPIIPILTGNLTLKVDEKKKFIIQVDREVLNEDDCEDVWYEDNCSTFMPHMELLLHIITTDGIEYREEIAWESSWRSLLQNSGQLLERELYVQKLEVKMIE